MTALQPAPAAPPTVMEARNLVKSFSGFVAVNDVSLTLEQGELRGLIGSNGAGKSTLLHLLYGREFPDRGAIVFARRDVSRLPPWRRARLGMALKFQVTSVFDDLTVEENLRLGAQPKTRVRAAGRDRLDEVLDLVGLTSKRLWRAGELSHGEVQWLEIGMVLLTQPSLLLLDEPTSGMTGAESRRTADLLETLRAQRAVDAMVIVEHDLEFIRLVSDRVTVMHRGAILAEGTVADIQSNMDVQDAYLGRLG
jgi:urea transport system ATP-binding protein